MSTTRCERQRTRTFDGAFVRRGGGPDGAEAQYFDSLCPLIYTRRGAAKPGPNVSSVPDSSTTIGAHFSTSITAISLALALGEPYPPAPHRVCSLAPLILAVCACRSCIRRQLASTNCTACRSQAGAAESSRARSACQELTLHRRISLVRVVLSHLSCAECCGWLYACTRFESSGSRARALPPHTACA